MPHLHIKSGRSPAFKPLVYLLLILVLSAAFFAWVADLRPSRVHQAEAQSPINVAAASQGSTVRYYDWYDFNNPLAPRPCRSSFPASAVIDGDRKGLNYGNGGVFSTCDDQYYDLGNGSSFIFSGPLIIDFNQLRTINHIDLFTAQDNLYNPVDPTPNMTFATEGTTDFFVMRYWDPDGLNWQPIYPATDWQNNYHVWKSGTFDNITTNKIRVDFNQNKVPPSHKFRITEVEAWQANSDHRDFGVFFTINQALIVANGQPASASYMFFPQYSTAAGGSAGYAPTNGEYYPIAYTFSNVPAGMSFSYPGYTMYSGTDPCLHDDNIISPECTRNSSGQLAYGTWGFVLYGQTNPGTYYFNMTATEQLDSSANRVPYTHTYVFRLDVLGADIKANGQETSTSVFSGNPATIDWSSYTDPDPAGYTRSGSPSCNVTPAGWSGLSGSQSTGPLTSPATYTATCSYAGVNISDSVTINISPPAQALVTAQCSNNSNGLFAESSSPGSGISCDLPAANQPGFIKWTSTNSADGLCSVSYNGAQDDHLSTTSNAANPSSAISTVPLSSSPSSYTFTINCSSSSGGASGSDTVTFNVINSAPYNLNFTSKHLITVNQPNLTTSQLAGANTNPCDGQGRVINPAYNLNEGDIATFGINICNTGGSDLVFNGSGDDTHAVIITDMMGNLWKPGSGWNPRINCGNDCQISSVDDSQYGRVVFTVQVKPGGTNRLLAAGGIWTLFFNATPVAPAGSSQSFFYLTTCGTNLTVHNAPAADDAYNNIIGQPFDMPGLCMQSLFFRGGNPPDRHEIAP
jgi:hypothetical protein